MTTPGHDERNEADLTTPLISVDEAREQPKSLEQMAETIGRGGVIAGDSDVSELPDEGEIVGKEDGLPGESAAIYQRGVTIIPPG